MVELDPNKIYYTYKGRTVNCDKKHYVKVRGDVIAKVFYCMNLLWKIEDNYKNVSTINLEKLLEEISNIGHYLSEVEVWIMKDFDNFVEIQ